MSMGLLYAHRRHGAAERSNVARPVCIWAGWESARDAALKSVRLEAALAMPKSALARGPAGLAQAKAWLATSTWSPDWTPPRLRRPSLSYVAGALVIVAAVLATRGLEHAVTEYGYHGAVASSPCCAWRSPGDRHRRRSRPCWMRRCWPTWWCRQTEPP